MHGAHNLARDQRHQAPHRKTKGQKRSSSAFGGRGILFFRKVKKFAAHQELPSPLRGVWFLAVVRRPRCCRTFIPVSRWLFCHGRTACPPGRARALRTVDAGRRHAMPRMRIDPSIGPGRSRTPRWKALDELFNLGQAVQGTENSATI